MDFNTSLPLKIFNFFNNYGILIGYTSYVFDKSKNTYVKGKYSNIIAIISNIYAFVSFLLWIHFTITFYAPLQNIGFTLLLCNSFISWIATMYTILHRTHRDRAFDELINELKHINVEYVSRQPKHIKADLLLRNFFLFKEFLFIMSVTSFGISYYQAPSWTALFVYIPMLNYFNTLQMLDMDYFIIILFIVHIRRYLNQHLNNITILLETTKFVDMDEVIRHVNAIKAYHIQLNSIIVRVCQVFSFQMLVLRFRTLFCALFVSYGTWIGVNFKLPIYLFAMILIYLMSIILNLYSNDTITDMCEQESVETLEILQQINQYTNTTKRFNRECEVFALYMAVCPTRIRIFKSIELNKSAYLVLVESILLYFLSVLQYAHHH